MVDVTVTIRDVLEAHGRLLVSLSDLSDDDELFENGLTSHASVNVMLAIEDAFDVEFPDSLLTKSTFESIKAIRGALESMGVEAPSD